VIAAVAAIAIGGTIAFFSDVETSTGNTFTAGTLDLKIDNECYYNGDPVAECTWGLSDLSTSTLFFNFTDLKPGDWGEDTVSLHVYDNDAWACVKFKNLLNNDNSCNEPECVAEGGTGCAASTTDKCGIDPNAGELAQNLNFFFWADVCKRLGTPKGPEGPIPPALPGDNIYQPYCDIPLMSGPASNLLPGPVTYTLADSDENNVGGGVGDPLTGSHDYFIGKAWCFGVLTPEITTYPNGYQVAEMKCDGQLVDNKSQSDSLTGDIEFYAEQARNNGGFLCNQLGI